MYLGQINWGDMDVADMISAVIEFVRIADMCGVTGMANSMAEHIRTTILSESPPYAYQFDSNTYLIEPRHIVSAAQLPDGHPVRRILATATVRGYFREDKHKFFKEAKEIPNFASDLLEAVKETLKTILPGDYKASLTDPFSKKEFYLHR
jgi:hypothetical protein